MKDEINDLIRACESKRLIIYSKNHYNVFKMLHQSLKGEPYKGENLPVLFFMHNGCNVSVLSDSLEQSDFDEEFAFI